MLRFCASRMHCFSCLLFYSGNVFFFSFTWGKRQTIGVGEVEEFNYITFGLGCCRNAYEKIKHRAELIFIDFILTAMQKKKTAKNWNFEKLEKSGLFTEAFRQVWTTSFPHVSKFYWLALTLTHNRDGGTETSPVHHHTLPHISHCLWSSLID